MMEEEGAAPRPDPPLGSCTHSRAHTHIHMALYMPYACSYAYPWSHITAQQMLCACGAPAHMLTCVLFTHAHVLRSVDITVMLTLIKHLLMSGLLHMLYLNLFNHSFHQPHEEGRQSLSFYRRGS